MKKMSLAAVKAIYKDFTVFETEDGFGVVNGGRYQPGITFLIPKLWEESIDGEPIDPLAWTPGKYEESSLVKKITANMNIGFNAKSIQIIFGDFWTSKKGSPCFRPKPVQTAKHILVNSNWGGSFEKTSGIGRSLEWRLGDHDQSNLRDITKKVGILYFKKASSNGGGLGHDYYVVPIGYKMINSEEDVEGREGRAKETRRLFFEDAKNKAAEVQAAREATATLGKRVEDVNRRFSDLGITREFFIGNGFYSDYEGGEPILLTEESVGALEARVAFNEKCRKEEENYKAIKNALADVLDEAEQRLIKIGAYINKDNYLNSKKDEWRCTISAKDVFPRNYRGNNVFSFSTNKIEDTEKLKVEILEVVKSIERVVGK